MRYIMYTKRFGGFGSALLPTTNGIAYAHFEMVYILGYIFSWTILTGLN